MMTSHEQEILSFMEMISDNDSAARCDAIRMITGLKDGRLLYPIIKSLQDDDLGVQQAAMDALLCYDDEAAVYNLIPLIADQRVAVKNLAQEILEKIGGSGLRLLHAHIHDRDEDVRKMIADIIGRLELPEAAPVLIEMLNDPNDNVKCSAMEGLGRITDQSIVEHLIALLGQGGWITLFAVESLGRLKNSRAVQPLVKLLNSSQSIDVQYMAIDSLSNIGGKESIAGLLEIIDFVKPEIMDIAVMGIVTMTQGNVGSVVDEFGREAFIVHLARAADNVNVSDQEDILNILQAFMSIGSSECAEEVLKLIEGIDRENQVLLNKAVEVMKETADENTLIDLLSHINQTVKLVSIRVLGLIRSGKAIPALSILFEEVERDLKKEILAAMGNIGGQNALRFISERLSCGDGHIRKSAVNALGSLASTEAIKPLLNQLHKEEYRDVIGTVVCALIEIGRRNKSQELAEGLLISLNSEKSAVREMVVRGLGELKWIDSSEHICGLLNDEDWRVRRACLEVLSCLSNTGFIENLIIAAHDEKDEVRMTVAQLLSENTDVSTATDVLIEMLEDNNDRIQLMAIEGLVRQNTPKAIPFIMRLAGSANYTVRKYSLWALGELGAYEAEHILRIAASDEDQEIHDAAIAAYNKLMSSKYVNH